MILVLLAYIGLYKFASDVLQTTARGRMEAPVRESTENSWMFLKHFLLIICLFLGMMAVGMATGSGVLVLLVGLIFALALPAAIMIVVMTNSLIGALNPLGWYDVIRHIGLPYFIAAGLLLLLMISSQTAQNVLAHVTGYGFVAALGVFFVGGYFMVAAFHLMGYLVYENHDVLGVEVDPRPEAAPGGAGETGDSPALQTVDAMVQAGDVDGAIEYLAGHLRHGGLPEEHDRYRKLLQLRGRTRELVDHARTYIPVLFYAHEQRKKAITLTEEALRMDPGFRPGEPEQVNDLAGMLFRFERYDAVLRLTSGFAQRHPGHPHIPDNYFLAAKALWYGQGNGEQAQKILRQLLRKYPEHPSHEEMTLLAKRIETAQLTRQHA